MAQQSLKKQSSYCVTGCSCFAEGGTAQNRSHGGSRDVCLRAMAVVLLWRSAGKWGFRSVTFFQEVPALHSQLWCLLLFLSDGG